MLKALTEKNFQIRQFQEADLDNVVHINRVCLPENYPSFFFMSIHYKYPKSFMVALNNDNTLCGYCMFRIEKGLSNFALRWTKKAHLVSIAVLEEYRKQGMGETLLLKGMQSMKEDYGSPEFILEVRVSNTAAITMYEKHSFKKIKTLNSYYRDGEDAFMMALRI
ncbi:MAG: GNAT family N-acetyltransferase [Candidatus Helarchaeota archaeon]|nr:GNAT family N-acetyltransferase [Candidatus Helarchaeota archaeon]